MEANKRKSESDVFIKKDWFIQKVDGSIDDFYTTTSKKTLGAGTYGSCIKVKHKETGEYRAVKIIPKNKVKDPARFLNEINIMRTLDHPNVIKLYENFEDSKNIYLVMELCEGGELFDRIIDKGHFSEREARKVYKDIVSAVAHCHSNNICHRDLKPENFLMLNKRDDSPVITIDFGLSHLFNEVKANEKKKHMHTKAGTPYYIAPEVLQGRYDESCDIWSLGVILYILLSGLPPFYGRNDAEILEMVKSKEYSFDIPEFDNVSDSAKDIIRKCLVSQEKRPKAHDILQMTWMTQDIPQSKLKLNYDRFQDFTQHNKLKKVALFYIASQCSEQEIIDLGELFKQMDKNNDGVLSIDEIRSGLKNLSSQNARDLENVMASIDTDGGGTINYTEFIAASLDKSIYLKEEKIHQAFKMLDLDKSGTISKSELKSVLGKHDDFKNKDDSYWEAMIKEVDKNGDGEIDYTEFTTMMANGALKNL